MDALKRHGVKNFFSLPLSFNLSQHQLEQLKKSSGVIISGGDTEKYHQYIVNRKIGDCITEMYAKGIPVAGFSAGTLICPSHCIIPPIDNAKRKYLFLSGLGLIDNCVISVHYEKWNEELNLKKSLNQTNVTIGYGINDNSGIQFTNEEFVGYEGDKPVIFERVNSIIE